MTLSPIENRQVRGVAAERYALNELCAAPDCTEKASDAHHCWRRSAIGNDSWFVVFDDLVPGADVGPSHDRFVPLPHVVGLCRHHHALVTDNRAWIRLEDGTFNWYEQDKLGRSEPGEPGVPAWDLIGPLNPQPGSREGKRKRKRKQAEPGRPKAVYAVRVPKDALEDGHAVLTELVEQVRDKLGPELGYTETVSAYFVIVAALVKALQA